MDDLINASFDSLKSIPDIGEVMAESIKEYFSIPANIELIEKLKKLDLNMTYLGKQIIKDDNFNDKKFVITGTISIMPRDRLKEEIMLKGGKVIDSVSKKTDVVIVGTSPGSKYDKAIELGINIWNEEELIERLGYKNE